MNPVLYPTVANRNTFALSTFDLLIVEALEKLAITGSAFGYPIKAYSRDSLERLIVLPTEKKEGLLSLVNQTVQILHAGLEIEKNDPSPNYPERRFVEQALSTYGYYVKDEDLWNTLEKDEFVEVYNSENIQVFRTFNFFKTSSYSLLDLLINEWFSLWERPSGTLTHMFNTVEGIFSGQIKGIAPVAIPEHIINEIFNAEDHDSFISRSSLCKFGIICAIYNKSDDKIGGLLVSARVKPVAVGLQNSNIAVI